MSIFSERKNNATETSKSAYSKKVYFENLSLATVLIGFLILSFGMWETFYSVKVSLSDMNTAMSRAHPFGTDQLGRDLLARYSVAVRHTVLPLWITGFLAFFAAIILASGTYILEERVFGKILKRFVGILSSFVLAFPFSVIVFAVSVYFEGISLSGILLSGFFYIFFKTFIKTIRMIEESRYLGYWEMHESLGGSRWERFFKYGVLNDFKSSLAAELVFSLQLLVAAEVTLSYLGFGVAEPDPSLGNILASNIESALKGEPRILLTSLFVLFLVMYIPSVVRKLIEKRIKPTA